jgi:hypothetical protein
MLKTFSVIAVNGGVLDSAANNPINGPRPLSLKAKAAAQKVLALTEMG